MGGIDNFFTFFHDRRFIGRDGRRERGKKKTAEPLPAPPS